MTNQNMLLLDVSDAIFSFNKSLKILNKSIVQASGHFPCSMFWVGVFFSENILALFIIFVIESLIQANKKSLQFLYVLNCFIITSSWPHLLLYLPHKLPNSPPIPPKKPRKYKNVGVCLE